MERDKIKKDEMVKTAEERKEWDRDKEKTR